MKRIDWNDMSALGLIERINREILHPLGLAVSRNPDTGVSESVFVSDDGIWTYGDDMASTIIPDNEVKKLIAEKVSANNMAKPTETKFNDVMSLLKERVRRTVFIMASDLSFGNELIVAKMIASDEEFLSEKKVKRLFSRGRTKHEKTQHEIIITSENNPTWGANIGDTYFFSETGVVSENTMKILRACSGLKVNKLFIINMSEG